MERGDGRFLTAMLGARAGEHAADLADERALHPETPGLIQEVAHLCAHVAEARGVTSSPMYAEPCPPEAGSAPDDGGFGR